MKFTLKQLLQCDRDYIETLSEMSVEDNIEAQLHLLNAHLEDHKGGGGIIHDLYMERTKRRDILVSDLLEYREEW